MENKKVEELNDIYVVKTGVEIEKSNGKPNYVVQLPPDVNKRITKTPAGR